MIFISYRHEDGLHVRAVQAALEGRLGEAAVMRDIKSSSSGGDLSDLIANLVADADTVLAIIGQDWLRPSPVPPAEARSGDRDWVRFELSLAIAWGKDVVPLLFEDARMPTRSELPGDLGGLADILAIRLRDSDWEADLGRLWVRLGAAADPSQQPAPGPPAVRDAGPVAGRDVIIQGDNVAGRDLRP